MMFPNRSSTLRLRATLALVAASFTGSPSVIADPSSASPPNAGTPSQTEYRAAEKAIAQKDWDTAQAILLRLWNQSHTYDVAGSLGQVEYFRRNYARSARYIAYALANVPPKEDPALIQRLHAALDELRPHVGVAHIVVDQPGADLSINGEAIGVSPLASSVFVEPGTCNVEARLGADRVATKVLIVSAGGAYDVNLRVPPPVAETPVSSASPLTTPPHDAGPITPDARPHRASKSVIPIYVGAGVTAVGLGMAIGFGVAAKDAEEDANKYRTLIGPGGCASGTTSPSTCKAANDAYDRQRRDAVVTDVGIGISVAGAVATLAYMLFWPSPPSKAETSTAGLQPVIGIASKGTALGLLGRF